MIIFVFYAGLVWYGAMIARRTPKAFAYILLGLLGVALMGYFHYKLNQWTDGRICLPVLQSLLYPYGFLIAGVGVFIACLPPRYSGTHCRSCGYDLRGLETDDRVCPECATRHVLFHGRNEPCRGCGAALKLNAADQAQCTRCGTVHLMIGMARPDDADGREEQVRTFDQQPSEPARPSARERIKRVLGSRTAGPSPDAE